MRLWIYPLLLLTMVLATFSQVRDFAFLNFDDPIYVVNNPWVNTGLSVKNIRAAFLEERGGHWHPLTWISHMIDVELFGVSSSAHHLVNVVFHAANSLLLFFLLTRFIPNLLVALFCSSLFALHPLRIESVAWVSERKDVLSLFFTLLTLHAYVSYARSKKWIYYVLVLLALILALLSKPMAVVVPALLIALDYWPLREIRIGNKFPLLLICMASSLATLWAQSHAGAMPSLDVVSIESRIEVSLVGYLTYLGKSLWPVGIGIFYPLIQYPPGVAAGAGLAMMLIAILCWSQRARRPYLLFGFAWFLIALLPVIGVISVGGQAFADRWSYLPHVGLLLALTGWLNEWIGDRSIAPRYVVLLCCLLLVTATVTYSQLKHWKNSETIFRHTLEVSPNNFIAHTNLGATLADEGRWEEAALHYEEAVRLNPTYPEALNNLGTLRAEQGRIPEAIAYFEKALQIRPTMEIASKNLMLAKQVNKGACGERC